MSSALVPRQTYLQPRPDAALPFVPWRDPHGVSPEALAVYIQELEQACVANPQSADLRTCLGVAHAVNYDVYKSMDALEEARCDDEALLSHLRSPGPHVRGCWALDLVLGKE